MDSTIQTKEKESLFLNNLNLEELDFIVNKLIKNDKEYIIKNKKKIIMVAYVMKLKNLTVFEAENILSVKLETDKILFLKDYQCYIKNKVRKNKNPILKYGLIILIGPPCSGKSTFSNNLLNSYGSETVLHINQDEIGKLESFRLLSENAKNKNKTIILDRCNLVKKDRKEYIDSYSCLSNRKILGIYFDFDENICKNRLKDRENHYMKSLKILEDVFKIKNIPENIPLKNEFNDFKIINDETSLSNLYKLFDLYIDGLKKFVRTRHLINLGSAGRDDLLYTKKEVTDFLNNYVIIEEKIDGANFGIFIDENDKIILQNRSHFITSSYHPQFKFVDDWLLENDFDIRKIINKNNWILYGEWCYAKHSIKYTSLPDYFILFDIYDRDIDQFLSRYYVEELIKDTRINLIKKIDEGYFDPSNLKKIENLAYSNSNYYDGIVEGVYLRIFDQENKYLKERAKIVRHNFIQEGDEHWTKNKIIVNNIKK